MTLAASACLLGVAPGCHSVRGDEALAMLEVSAALGVPSFTTARFSVAGRPDIVTHEVPYDGKHPLRFGYYLPGPNGTLRITGQALSASCLLGTGNAEVDVHVGRVSTSVTLLIKPLTDADPACAPANDGGAVDDAGAKGDGAPTDGPGDAVDAPDAAAVPDAAPALDGSDAPPPIDAKPDVPPTPPPPACMAATKACPGAAECCSGLVCGTTSLGRVCCGNYDMTCTRAGGEDCCGQLECVSGHCCLPATYACTGGSCCPGLVCGTTSLGRVCCGNAGAPCKRAGGEDCCGALECVNGVCK